MSNIIFYCETFVSVIFFPSNWNFSLVHCFYPEELCTQTWQLAREVYGKVSCFSQITTV